ncbi:hypothetical protein [Flavobacterium profundi]|nr:hypothetical protein [Flavobacterium profundi]
MNENHQEFVSDYLNTFVNVLSEVRLSFGIWSPTNRNEHCW